jgi:hypothetical protein
MTRARSQGISTNDSEEYQMCIAHLHMPLEFSISHLQQIMQYSSPILENQLWSIREWIPEVSA